MLIGISKHGMTMDALAMKIFLTIPCKKCKLMIIN